MTQIDLSKPLPGDEGKIKVQVGFGKRWRTVFVYQCSQGHKVQVFASAYQGRTPVPGVGAIECPKCE